MGKYFEFATVSKYHIIALLVPLFCMCTSYIQSYQLKYYNENLRQINGKSGNCTESDCMISEFPFYFNIFISKDLSFFLIILSRYLNKKNIIREPAMRRYHLEVNNTKRKIKTGLFVILISILEIIFKIEGYLIYGKQNYIELKLGFVLFVPLLSKFILKKELFKHHIFSFFISVIGFIFIILSLLFIDENYKPVLNDQIIHFFYSFPLSLSFVLIKYIFEKSFLNAYEFLFYDGILCIILPFIIIAFKTIFKGSDYFINNMSGISILFYDNKSIFFFYLYFSFLFAII